MNAAQQDEVNRILEAFVLSEFFDSSRQVVIEFLWSSDAAFQQHLLRLLQLLFDRHLRRLLKPEINILLAALPKPETLPAWGAFVTRFTAAFTHYQGTGQVPEQQAREFAPKPAEAPRPKRRYVFPDDPPLTDIADKTRSIPTTLELDLLGERDFPVRTNPIVNGEGFGTLQEYLDTQWRLLRADALEDIRTGLLQLKKARNRYADLIRSNAAGQSAHPGPFKFPRSTAYFTYVNVQLVATLGTKGIGSANALNFIVSFEIPNMQREMDWTRSRRLMPGSLLVLSSDSFNTLVWGVVAARDEKLLKQRRVAINIQSGDLAGFRAGLVYEMLETRAFWTSYSHVLSRFASFTEQTFPLIDFIVGQQGANNDHAFPGALQLKPILVPEKQSRQLEPFLTRRNAQLERRVVQWGAREQPAVPIPLMPPLPQGHILLDDGLVGQLQGLQVNPPALQAPQPAPVPDGEDDPGYPRGLTILDPSQWEAMKMILMKRVSIIQGPPGTGKTFIGLKAAEILLKQGGFRGPILCVCYTNHALDQFLEGVLKFCDKVVRIGGRSKSEELNKRNINNLFERYERSFEVRKNIAKREESRTEIMSLYRQLNDPTGVYNDFFQFVNVTPPHKTLTKMTKYLYQLLGAQTKGVVPKPAILPTTPQARPSAATDEDEEQEELDDDAAQELANREAALLQADGDDEPEYDDVMFKEQLSTWLHENTGLEALLELCGRVTMPDELIERSLNRHWAPGVFISLPIQERRNVFAAALHMRRNNFLLEIQAQTAAFDKAARYVQEYDQGDRADFLRTQRVIGMTTTGAAQNSSMLSQLGAKVVIIEEAAEIFEAHSVACLSRSVEKLILIGDHQQLRPKVTYYPLTKRGLDISLFERLILSGLPHVTLQKQHRMHPDISRYIRPIYPRLLDGPNAMNREQITCIAPRTFFVNHSWLEAGGGQKEDIASSKKNEMEAKYIFGLVRYLLTQGYKPEQINVIAMYNGQAMLLRTFFRQPPAGMQLMTPDLKIMLPKVRVCSVDDFQGEENPIIVSLVRNNTQGISGFVNTANRICVSLSRAQCAMCILGSEATLRKAAKKKANDGISSLWPPILDLMLQHNAIGPALPISCVVHRHNRQEISDPSQWNHSLSGCTEPCGAQRECGHWCNASCHGLLPHSPCFEDCQRVFDDCKHKCTKYCYQECGDCQQSVPHVFEPCGHENQVLCHKLKLSKMGPNVQLSCPTPCDRILPCGHRCPLTCGQRCVSKCLEPVNYVRLSCGHIVPVLPCHKANNAAELAKEQCNVPHPNVALDCGHTLNNVPCRIALDRKLLNDQPHPCNFKFDCGHTCIGVCQACRNSGQHAPCVGKCGRMLPCSHTCKDNCKNPCPPCKENCRIKCVHGPCRKKCHEKCIPCMSPCLWSCPHAKCEHPCSDLCTRPPCNEPCLKPLACTHPCIGLCGEICPTLCRVCQPNTEVFQSYSCAGPIKDDDETARYIQLPDCHHVIAVESMDHWMRIQSEDSASIQLPSCPKCKSPMTRVVGRYANHLKQKLSLLDEIRTKYLHDDIRRKFQKGQYQAAKEGVLGLLKRKAMGHSMHPPERDISMLLILAHSKLKVGDSEKSVEDIIQEILTRDPQNAEAKALEASLTSKIMPLLVNALKSEIKHGAWYKCANGHPYAIGECGGAMQQARCPCGATIGGANHALAAGNTHAAVDGSRHAAWSDAANMANYQLDE